MTRERSSQLWGGTSGLGRRVREQFHGRKRWGDELRNYGLQVLLPREQESREGGGAQAEDYVLEELEAFSKLFACGGHGFGGEAEEGVLQQGEVKKLGGIS